MRKLRLLAGLALVLSGCGSSDVDISNLADIPVIEADQFEAMLLDLDRPAVVNVWASWCIPCRSEAPLLIAAHETHGNDIEFIGVDVQDTQANAKQFIAEFNIEFENVFDRNRTIPGRYGAIGTPITFFFAPGGDLVITHPGVIDERALAIGIDELLRYEG